MNFKIGLVKLYLESNTLFGLKRVRSLIMNQSIKKPQQTICGLLAFCCYGVNNFPHFGHLRGGKTAALSMLVNQRLVVSNINAKGFVACNVGVLPFNFLFLL